MLLIYCREVNELRCICFKQSNIYIQHAVTYRALSNGPKLGNGQYYRSEHRAASPESFNFNNWRPLDSYLAKIRWHLLNWAFCTLQCIEINARQHLNHLNHFKTCLSACLSLCSIGWLAQGTRLFHRCSDLVDMAAVMNDWLVILCHIHYTQAGFAWNSIISERLNGRVTISVEYTDKSNSQ